MEIESIQHEKKKLRKEISTINKLHSLSDLSFLSEKVMHILETSTMFRNAHSILIYHNLPREVETINFINKWLPRKEFYLPVVIEDNIVFRQYTEDTSLTMSSYNISEPDGESLSDYDSIDLVVIPGVAFDKKMNRMGKGKGYYDRFLRHISATKVGICFNFQLFESIPASDFDIKMDYVISDKGIIVYE